MARTVPASMRAIDLVDAQGAASILMCSKSRVHQLAEQGKLHAYVFIDGELAIAEGLERQGKIALFNRYEVGEMRSHMPGRGGRPRKTSFPTSS